jgi:hypothetical protein
VLTQEVQGVIRLIEESQVPNINKIDHKYRQEIEYTAIENLADAES